MPTIPFIDHTDCIPDWYTPCSSPPSRSSTERPSVVRASSTPPPRATRGRWPTRRRRPTRCSRRRPSWTPTWSGPAPSTSRPATPTTRPTGATRTRGCGRGSRPSSQEAGWSRRGSTWRPRSRTTCCAAGRIALSRARRARLSYRAGGGRAALRPASTSSVDAGEFVERRRPERLRQEHAAAGAGRRARRPARGV